MKLTRREVFGMFAGLIGVPPVAVASYPDFRDPSFDMAAYLKAEWDKNLYTTCADVDKAFVENIVNPITGLMIRSESVWKRLDNADEDPFISSAEAQELSEWEPIIGSRENQQKWNEVMAAAGLN